MGGSIGTDCYTLAESGMGVNVGMSIDFCSQYISGVSCAVTVMLDGVESQFTPGAEAHAGFSAEIPYNCD